MASTQSIKSRIRSVRSTKQITKAMELVAASKMRRAQEATSQTRLYSSLSREILTRLSQLTDVKGFPLFEQRQVKTRLIILVSSDRGLAGAYNANVFKQFIALLRDDQRQNITTNVITIGKKGSAFVGRLKGVTSVGAYHEMPDRPDANDIRPVLTTAIEGFIDGRYDDVSVVYTNYINSLRQEPKVQRLLPAGFEQTDVSNAVASADFEPSVNEVIEGVTRRLVEVQLFQAMLDSIASEHSMRMVAMRNASDNATNIADDLTLELNNARQAAITQELAEITGGAEALNG